MTGKSNFKPSPYIVASSHGYTKHIYAGAERVCTKLGSGGLDSLFQTSDSLLYNARILIKKQLDDMPGRRIDAAPVICNRKIDGTTGGDLTTHQTEKVSVRVDANFKYERFHDEMDDCHSDHGTETSRYFYHPDHLGSASWITDANGQPIQHMQYLPYGETRIDQRTSTYNERYTFTGKEKDSETGYYYFGARYYNPDLSLWLSVDPMADKYPSLSPYNYCAWNRMKLVDPNGDTCKFATKEDEAYVKQLIDKNSNVYSQAFAEKYEKLDASPHNYLFESWDYDESRSESGLFLPNTSKNTSTIKFTKGETPETRETKWGMSEFRNLFEETFHTWKYETNNYINVPSCLSEAMAWKFSTLAPGTNLIENGKLTFMGYLFVSDVETIAIYFKFGFKNEMCPREPLYLDLPLYPDNQFRRNLGLREWK